MVESITSKLLIIFLTTTWSLNWSCPCDTYIGCQRFTQHSAAGHMAK